MSRPAPPPAPVLAVLAAGATWATLWSWARLSDAPGDYLEPLAVLVLVVAGTGVLLRAARAPRPLVLVGQVLTLGVVLNHRWAEADSRLGWVPTEASVRTAVETLRTGVAAATEFAAPVPASADAFAALLVAAGVAVALVVDALACTLRLPSLAGLPLLAAFTAPLGIVEDVSWLTFVVAGTLFVLMLTADQANRLSGWGRTDDTHRVGFAALFPAAARLGVVGVLAAALIPTRLPDPEGVLDRREGGSGGGGTGVNLENPLVDIRRDLTQGPDVPVVYVETDQPNPGYLRTSVLDSFDGLAWEPAERSIPANQQADGELPPPPGLSGATAQRPYDNRISTTDDFRSVWLPAPYPPARMDVEGDWRFDVATLDVITTEGGDASSSLTYDVTALDVAPTAEQLVRAPAPPRGITRSGTDLPDSTPMWIRELADAVVEGSGSDFESAVRLQDWFRRDGGFEYSLDRGSGNGIEQLELFLGTGPGSRTGYCEQFASAMSMMARSLGIPARVAVGFLRPEPAGPGRWVYSSRDLHSWPELYFEGAGWIRFEPTPQARAVGVPTYTAGQVPQPEELPSPSASASPSAPTPERTEDALPEGGPESSPTDTGSTRWWWALPALLLALLALVPPAWRSAVARRRRESGTPAHRVEGAWAEVRATALDLGLRWDDSVTLRRQAKALVPAVGASVGAVRTLQSLVLLVERSRYSGREPSTEDAETATRWMVVVTEALRGAASGRARRRARGLPASLWRGGRQPVAGASSPAETEKVSV